jgi:hypothetical protein
VGSTKCIFSLSLIQPHSTDILHVLTTPVLESLSEMAMSRYLSIDVASFFSYYLHPKSAYVGVCVTDKQPHVDL